MESTINENKRHVDDKYSYRRNEYYGKCPTCNRYNTNWAWCQSCDLKLLTEGWTSGNETLDELIKSTQLETEYYYNKCYLEWIPYNDLTNIERIEEGGFATIYKATWLNGEKYLDDDDKRTSKDRTVVLKQLHDSQNISNEFLNEFKNYIKFHYNFYIIHLYGLAQDPITKEYIFVMDYIENGSLQNYLTKDFKILNWENKINILLQIINGLEDIHKEEIIHRDLHSGNILLESDKYKYDGIDSYTSYIADLGLSCPASQTSAPNKNDIFGVLPYVAPEVLKGEPYTKASDIYSFGVLMSVMSTSQQPFNNLAHDEDLMIKICEGVRPGFSNNTGKFYIELAFRCMDANPDKRPTAKEIRMIINFWNDSFGNYSKMGLGRRYSKEQQDELKSIVTMFHEMDEIKADPLGTTAAIHPNAVYTSRLLKFTRISQPVNPNKVTVIGDNNDSRQIEMIT